MALFGKKKEQKKETQSVAGARKNPPSVKAGIAPTAEGAGVLIRPHITEKASQATARSVYTFDVRADATKRDIRNAIIVLYKVVPVRVAIAKTPATRVHVRTRRGWGTKSAKKKAYVYLKEGDRIEFAS